MAEDNLIKWRGFLPSYPHLAQDGKPVQTWDGGTFCTPGNTWGIQPSKDTRTQIDVVGLGTDWPWGFTKQEIVKLYWRINWSYGIQVSCSIGASTSFASCLGVPMYSKFDTGGFWLFGDHHQTAERALIPGQFQTQTPDFDLGPLWWDPSIFGYKSGPIVVEDDYVYWGYDILPDLATTRGVYPLDLDYRDPRSASMDITKLPGYGKPASTGTTDTGSLYTIPAWGWGCVKPQAYNVDGYAVGSADATDLSWSTGGSFEFSMSFSQPGYVQKAGSLGGGLPAEDLYWPMARLQASATAGFDAGGPTAVGDHWHVSLGNSAKSIDTINAISIAGRFPENDQPWTWLPTGSIQKVSLANMKNLPYYLYDNTSPYLVWGAAAGVGWYIPNQPAPYTYAAADSYCFVNSIDPFYYWPYYPPAKRRQVFNADGSFYYSTTTTQPKYNWWDGSDFTGSYSPSA